MKKWIWVGIVIALALAGGTTLNTVDTDKTQVERLAEAISFAEGFYVDGSRPRRNNNPGDLTQPLGFPYTGMDGIYVIFKTFADGWNALLYQVSIMLNNTSHIYNRDMSIREVASHYTTTEQDEWANNVASYLGVTTDTRISEV